MDPVKVQAITDWPTPTKLKELRSFLGFGNYYKDFIAQYSKLTRPLHELTKKLVTWHWDDAHRTAFQTLKDKFTSYPVLRNPDPTKKYILDTDASLYAVGATISQEFSDGGTLLRTFPSPCFQQSAIMTYMIENYLLLSMP